MISKYRCCTTQIFSKEKVDNKERITSICFHFTLFIVVYGLKKMESVIEGDYRDEFCQKCSQFAQNFDGKFNPDLLDFLSMFHCYFLCYQGNRYVMFIFEQVFDYLYECQISVYVKVFESILYKSTL